MFDSLFRGLKMIWASLKMGWSDKRLLMPSILIVCINILFSSIFILDGIKQMADHAGVTSNNISAPANNPPSYGFLNNPSSTNKFRELMSANQLNGAADPNGSGFLAFDNLPALFTANNLIIAVCLAMLWWLTNRFFEGVTTAMVYGYLTEGKGTCSFSQACWVVFQSLPAIIVLGFVTFIVKRLASFLRGRGPNQSSLGMGFGFLSQIVEIFWTLAGHLILPAIVIEGCSFWGALKRADKMAQGSLLAIGFGEVGVDLFCHWTSILVYMAGMAGLGSIYYFQLSYFSFPVILGACLWVTAVVTTTALSIYIRSAFYTCLYVWAIEAEGAQLEDRQNIKAPAPLAAALA